MIFPTTGRLERLASEVRQQISYFPDFLKKDSTRAFDKAYDTVNDKDSYGKMCAAFLELSNRCTNRIRISYRGKNDKELNDKLAKVVRYLLINDLWGSYIGKILYHNSYIFCYHHLMENHIYCNA